MHAVPYPGLSGILPSSDFLPQPVHQVLVRAIIADQIEPKGLEEVIGAEMHNAVWNIDNRSRLRVIANKHFDNLFLFFGFEGASLLLGQESAAFFKRQGPRLAHKKPAKWETMLPAKLLQLVLTILLKKRSSVSRFSVLLQDQNFS